MSLPRLTEESVRKAVEKAGGQAAGYYALCTAGYRPDEIAICAPGGFKWANDIRQTVRTHAEKHELAIPASCARRREAREPVPAPNWQDAFRSTVMRTGLHLALSQGMLEFLCATADGVLYDRFGTRAFGVGDNYLTIRRALEKRGLIRDRVAKYKSDGMQAHTELTEAGQHVIALLRCCGVFVEADNAIKKRSGGEATP